MPLWEETCRGHREHEIAFSWILTYGTVRQQVAVLVVQQQVRDRYKLVIRRAEIKSNRRTDAIPLCGVLSPARAPWLLLSASSCLWHLLPHRPTVQPFSAQGGDNREMWAYLTQPPKLYGQVVRLKSQKKGTRHCSPALWP